MALMIGFAKTANLIFSSLVQKLMDAFQFKKTRHLLILVVLVVALVLFLLNRNS